MIPRMLIFIGIIICFGILGVKESEALVGSAGCSSYFVLLPIWPYFTPANINNIYKFQEKLYQIQIVIWASVLAGDWMVWF